MAKGFKHGTGGGSSLNFKVVGNPQPENPKENTIWVDTDTTITSWVFSATQPLLDGEDLYATAEKKAGYYLDASGNEVKNEDHEILTIDLPEGTTHIIVTGAHYTTSTVAHCFYGASGNFISSVLRNNGTFEYAVPSEAKSVRVTLKPNDVRSVIVCDSSKQEGMVWISTGTSSTVEFNALKKNEITVYPMMAKQYVNGAWVTKTAKTYQNGAWVEWAVYLYKDGNQCEDITGGWKTRGWLEGGNGSYALEPTAMYGENSVTITSSTTNSYQYTGVWETKKDIDLTNIKTIRFHVLSATISGQYLACDFGVHNRANGTSGSHLARVNLEASTTPRYYDLNVSSISGSYDVALRVGGGKTNIKVTIDEIRLLKEGEA